MKRIWLVRHGESKAQTMEQYSFDADLSKFGEEQAQALQEALSAKNINFSQAYVSPLRRARQTFEFINSDEKISNNPQTECFFDVRLIEEMPKESYQTLLPYELLPDYAKLINNDAWLLHMNENIADFCDTLLMKKEITGDILIVCHMGVLNYLMRQLQSYCSSPDKIADAIYYFHNCSYSIVEIADDFTCDIVELDNINHLKEKKLLR
ncbi:histidine phosphatase family protein [Lentisphaerota bacterium WC36G]|nr:phosphoglycerate mutase family protein [Lentisphaerae bacterium WC36]